MGILETIWGEHSYGQECQFFSHSIRDYTRSAQTIRVPARGGLVCVICDTDSVIYVENVSEPKRVKTGEYLGDLTDELESMGQAPILKSLSGVALKIMRFLSFAMPQENEQQSEK